MTFNQVYTLVVVVLLVVALYREIVSPATVFFLAGVALVIGRIITPQDLVMGLSNVQIIIIFLLVLVTAGLRGLVGSKFFEALFKPDLKPRQFLLRMMMFVSSTSAFLNNTPIVAFMIPFLKEWSQKAKVPASKFLIPLSFSTILGGMITVLGTSTNLVLNGLIQDYKLPLLGFTDFVFLGVIVTLVGWTYFYFVGYRLLPEHAGRLDVVKSNLKEYIVETELFPGSKLIGKTVKDAGLRNLSDLFLVEILRGEEIISPVAPEEKLESGDLLFFSGHTESIYNLIKEDNGLGVHKATLEAGSFTFLEAVVPANSNLIGVKIKNSDFRKKYDASIVAVHRDGKRISGKVGETELQGGDFLLLVSDEDHEKSLNTQNLFFLSVPKSIGTAKPRWFRYLGLASFSILLLGITNVIPLFFAVLILLCGFVFLGVVGRDQIREELDLSLLMVLVCSLAIGVALDKSGAADLIATGLIFAGKNLGSVGVLTSLFIVTIILTSLITNAAAVSIVFPIAMAIANQLHLPSTPFFVAIAFAASGDFMTPIGYQTNLMVYGPGGYSFRDFFKVGAPFTILYSIICLVFITYYYSLA